MNSISDKDGMVYIIKLKAGETEIKEIKAPEGYIKTNKLTKISVDDNNNVNIVSPKDSEGNGKFDDPFIVKNDKQKTTDISVTKKWVGDKAEDRPDSITVNLLKNGERMESEVGRTGIINNVIYDRAKKGFRLEQQNPTELTNGQMLAICKILLDSRALLKTDMIEILNKLIENCVTKNNQKEILDLIKLLISSMSL